MVSLLLQLILEGLSCQKMHLKRSLAHSEHSGILIGSSTSSPAGCIASVSSCQQASQPSEDSFELASEISRSLMLRMGPCGSPHSAVLPVANSLFIVQLCSLMAGRCGLAGYFNRNSIGTASIQTWGSARTGFKFVQGSNVSAIAPMLLNVCPVILTRSSPAEPRQLSTWLVTIDVRQLWGVCQLCLGLIQVAHAGCPRKVGLPSREQTSSTGVDSISVDMRSHEQLSMCSPCNAYM